MCSRFFREKNRDKLFFSGLFWVCRMVSCGLVLCLGVFFLSGCGSRKTLSDISMEEVLEANKTENLLKYYSSFCDRSVINGSWDYDLYVDREIYYYNEGELKCITGEDFQFVYQDGEYSSYLLADGAEYDSWYDNLHLDESVLDETIVEALDDGKTITIETEIAAGEWEEYFNSLEIDYLPEDYVSNIYEVDSENYALQKSVTALVHPDGTSEEIASMTISYDEERPEEAKELLERARPSTDIRTITVVLDPNTENEKVCVQMVKKGELFGVILPEGYELYQDEACTIPADGKIDTNAHVLVYAKAKE